MENSSLQYSFLAKKVLLYRMCTVIVYCDISAVSDFYWFEEKFEKTAYFVYLAERILRFSDSLHSIFDRYYSESWTGSNASLF